MALGHRNRRSWKITVHAKISNLYIKLKATLKRPSGRFQRLVKLDKLLIGVDSQSESRILIQRRRTLKSRILGFFEKHLWRRRSNTTVGFKMPDDTSKWPYVVTGTENQSWHLSRLEIRFVAAFGVGLGAEFCPTLKKNVGINSRLSSSWLIMILMWLVLLWLHKCKFLWAMLIPVLSFLLLEMDAFLEHLDLR